MIQKMVEYQQHIEEMVEVLKVALKEPPCQDEAAKALMKVYGIAEKGRELCAKMTS